MCIILGDARKPVCGCSPCHGEVAPASAETVLVTGWCALHRLSISKAWEQPSATEASLFQDMVSRFLHTQPLICLLWERWQFSCTSGAPSFARVPANMLCHSLPSLIALGLLEPAFSFPVLPHRLSACLWYSQLSSPRLLWGVLMATCKPFLCACCVLCLCHESADGGAALLKSRGSCWPALAEALMVVNEPLREADPIWSRCGRWSWEKGVQQVINRTLVLACLIL